MVAKQGKQGTEENVWTGGEEPGWRRLYNEELHNLYALILVGWSYEDGWDVWIHILNVGKTKMCAVFKLGNMNGGHYLEDLVIDGGIILERMLRKQGWRYGLV